MTTRFISAVLLFLVMSTSFISCKKEKDDVEEPRDLAASVAGSYDMNYLRVKTEENDIDTNLPFNSTEGRISGVVDVDKKGENAVTVVMTLMQDGQNVGETPFGNEVQLKKENASVGLYIGADKIGTIDGNDLNISITGGGDELIIKARK